MTASSHTSQVIAIEDVLPIVDAVVAQLGRHLPAHVSAQDLASAGKLALMEVVGDFGGSFAQDRGYVVCRVRGAVLDEMRRLDPLSRHGRAQVKLVRRAVAALEESLNRAPTDRELGEHVGLSADSVRRIRELGTSADSVRSDAQAEANDSLGALPDGTTPSPAEAAETSDRAELVRAALSRLSPNQSQVLQLYYFTGATLQEIAGELGLSVVRVHQIRAAAEARVRQELMAGDGRNGAVRWIR